MTDWLKVYDSEPAQATLLGKTLCKAEYIEIALVIKSQ